MALNIWQRAKITSVFAPAGPDGSGGVKYARQNFDVMRWASPGNSDDETWVVSPRADAYTPVELDDTRGNILEEGLVQDYGWYTADRLIIDSDGSPDAAGERLIDFHFFGPV